jgi:hypothetical protein
MGCMTDDTRSNVVPIRSDEEELLALEERVLDALEEQDRAEADPGDADVPVGLRSYRRRGQPPELPIR